MNYVDTSLVVAALDTSEPSRSRDATAMLERGGEKVVSELFLVELASAISRKSELIAAARLEDSQPPTILLAYLVYLMSKYDLRLLGSSGEQVTTPFGRVSAEAGSCLGIAADLKLRSLDLLHLAHMLSLKERGYSVEALLTSDAEFLKAERFLAGRGVKVLVLKDAK